MLLNHYRLADSFTVGRLRTLATPDGRDGTIKTSVCGLSAGRRHTLPSWRSVIAGMTAGAIFHLADVDELFQRSVFRSGPQGVAAVIMPLTWWRLMAPPVGGREAPTRAVGGRTRRRRAERRRRRLDPCLLFASRNSSQDRVFHVHSFVGRTPTANGERSAATNRLRIVNHRTTTTEDRLAQLTLLAGEALTGPSVARHQPDRHP